MDLLSQQLLKPRALPINIISSCFGIPIVLWAIIKEKNFMA
jgi:ABC-type Fe3+-siderophore transport system permease subunit